MSSEALIEKFIYSCSHDLRGPVTTIQGLVKLAEEHPQLIDLRDCIRMIGECSGKLDNLIHGLQEFMQIEVMNVEPVDVQMQEVIGEAIGNFDDQIEGRKILIERNNDPVVWRTDPYCVKEILKKVLSNCITFRDPRKDTNTIAIAMEHRSGNLFLKIRDNGLGIPENQQSRLFNVFFRAHEISKGPGLGLFLVKRMMKKLGGAVAVVSVEGVGTTVIIRLPLLNGQHSTGQLSPILQAA
jgi:signal transduction histidine kinase